MTASSHQATLGLGLPKHSGHHGKVFSQEMTQTQVTHVEPTSVAGKLGAQVHLWYKEDGTRDVGEEQAASPIRGRAARGLPSAPKAGHLRGPSLDMSRMAQQTALWLQSIFPRKRGASLH